ncbi:hypothetical protein K3495_g5411 [Podosphaera aphanis]|nr:hypothetical protein K3495_g5411 [Podosphaera aphanis]
MSPLGWGSSFSYRPVDLKKEINKLWRKAANIYTEWNTNQKRLNFKDTSSELHRHLTRAQSSIATQIRSEHIGFNSYLYRRKVPGVDDPSCTCGFPSRNVEHMIMACLRWSEGSAEVWRKAKERSFKAMMNGPKDIARITRWIIKEGWLEQFRLAENVGNTIETRRIGSESKRVGRRV